MTQRASDSGRSHSAAYKKAATPQQRRRQAAIRPWRWFDVIWVAATLVIASVLTTFVLGNGLTELMPEIGRVGVRVALLVVFYLLELVVLAYLAHRRELPFTRAYRLRTAPAATESQPAPTSAAAVTAKLPLPTAFSVALVVIFLVTLRLLAIGYNLLTTQLGWPAPSSENLTTLFGTNLFGLVGAVATVVILAPLIEELVFRVVMQETFAKKLPAALAAIAQALIFSLYHLSLWAALPNFLLALACGLLARKSKTALPAITLHILYNATVVAAAFYYAQHP